MDLQASTSQSRASSEAPKEKNPAKDSTKSVACTGCRAIKVRCVVPPGNLPHTPCTRCIRLDFQCEYKTHLVRGRKPRDSSTSGASKRASVSPVMASHGASSIATLPSPSLPILPLSLPTLNSTDTSPSGSSPGLFAGTPSASAGDNSLLALAEAAEAKSAARYAAPAVRPRAAPLYADPVDLHVLGMAEATLLVTEYHNILNNYVQILDRRLYTTEYIRRTSSILFTAVLAVSAKFFRSDLYPQLLAHAQQLVSRGIADCLLDIGLVQALCLLVYWKEASDGSAWMKVGMAVRLAMQLGLHVVRKEPLPTDELLARQTLNRERAWHALICFDHHYQLHGDASSVNLGCMTAYDHRNELQWLREGIYLGNTDDIHVMCCIRIGKVIQLKHTLETSGNSDILMAHLDHTLQELRTTYLDVGSEFYDLTPLRLKLRMHWHEANSSIGASCLKANPGRHDLMLSYVDRTQAYVDVMVEVAEAGMLTYFQDTTAAALFSMGEFFVKLFPTVHSTYQTTLVRWMSSLWTACNGAAAGNECCVAAFIARFFRHALRNVADELPSTATDPALGTDVVLAPLQEHDVFSGFDALEGLGGMSQSLDGEYWDSLFPGSIDSWSWLTSTTANAG